MKRVLTMVVLSWLLAAASGCCCCGPYLCAVGRHVFGPWHCGHRHHACGVGCGDCCEPCGDPCGYDDAYFAGGCGGGPGHGHCGDAYGYGTPAPCGCCDSGCGECSWYHTGCHSCCGCWGCGDVYLTDLFHPICDPCWNRGCWGGHGHHGCGCHGGYDAWDGPGPGDCGCGGPCGGDDWGPYAAAPRRPAWMADGSSISVPGAQGPQMSYGQRPYVMQRPRPAPGRSISAQAMRGPWEAPSPSRGHWAMNREFVVSQPKVVDDRVVESRPKAPAKKTVRSSPATDSVNR